ncbi:MAG: hypothetical protein KDD34_08100, partial [Bdellovibrionales bacterium]|nr:hypothetical protein [Bdellovibrionales bacterium]
MENDRWDYGISGFVQEKLKSYDEQVKEQTPKESEDSSAQNLSYYYKVQFLSDDIVSFKSRDAGSTEFRFHKNKE